MNIRLAKVEDLETLHNYDRHVSRQELANSVSLNRVYVAEENGQVIGWLRYNLFWDNTPFMNMLYLLDENRGKGYGKQLAFYWEQQMKEQKYEMIMTSTAADEYAQHFYHKLGYETIGGFLMGGDPYEVILAKKI